jgi:hypothetical protein
MAFGVKVINQLNNSGWTAGVQGNFSKKGGIAPAHRGLCHDYSRQRLGQDHTPGQ